MNRNLVFYAARAAVVIVIIGLPRRLRGAALLLAGRQVRRSSGEGEDRVPRQGARPVPPRRAPPTRAREGLTRCGQAGRGLANVGRPVPEKARAERSLGRRTSTGSRHKSEFEWFSSGRDGKEGGSGGGRRPRRRRAEATLSASGQKLRATMQFEIHALDRQKQVSAFTWKRRNEHAAREAAVCSAGLTVV